MTEGLFYVYEHWRPDRDECFYVGKGHDQRAHDMRRGRNRHHKFVQAKLNRLGLCVDVRIVADGLTEPESFALEIERIAFWRADGADLVNMSAGGEGPSGMKHTEEWKRANSERMKNRIVGPETREKIAAFHRGKRWALGTKRPQHAIDATAAATRGTSRSDETKAKLREIRLANPTFKGKTHTAEWRAAQSERQRGRLKSEETKARMRKPKSEAHKQKLRELNLGKTHSEETRRLLSEKAKLDWARRKAATQQHQLFNSKEEE